jgi:hypothetical protein
MESLMVLFTLENLWHGAIIALGLFLLREAKMIRRYLGAFALDPNQSQRFI